MIDLNERNFEMIIIKRGLKLGSVASCVLLMMSLMGITSLLRASEPGVSGSSDLGKYLINLPFTMPEMKEPQFPNTSVTIMDFGAIGDGLTMNTQAFANAIQKCVQSGGGTVVVPPGTWLTGPIKLESNINLHLERGALVLFSKRFEDFPLVAGYDGKSKKYVVTPPVYAYRATNIAITGAGVFNGSGEAWRYVKKDKLTDQQWKELVKSGGVISADGKEWWPSKAAMEGESYLKTLEKSGKEVTAEDYAKAREFLRPDLIRFIQCDGVLLDGPSFENSPRFHVHLVQSENIIIRNINIYTEWYAQNGDALDISACRNVLVYKSTINAGDDGICIKPANISQRQKEGPACENIVIEDCLVHHAHGGFVIGSETSGGAKNIYVKNCIFSGTDVGLRFKSLRGRGGLIENIYVDSVRMNSIAQEAILFDLYYGDESPDVRATTKKDLKTTEPVTDKTPRLQNFSIKNIFCDGANRAMLINGLPEMPVKNIVLENITIRAKTGVLCVNADSISIKNATILPDGGPIVIVNQSTNILLNTVTYPQRADAFLSVMGDKTQNIQVGNVDLTKAKEKAVFDEKASKESVIYK